MPRRAKSIHLHLLDKKKHLTKEEISQRMEAEAALRPDSDKVKPPTWLSKDAKKEFKFLAQALLDIKQMTNTDVHMLAVYCDAYVEYVECGRIVDAEGIILEYTNTAGETNKIAHPALTKKKAAFDIMSKIAAEYGFTPSSRARIAIPKKPQKAPSDFDAKFGDV